MNDIADNFRALTDDEKIENFEESTTTAILKQLGVRNSFVQKLRSEYGPAFGLDWLNERFNGCTSKATRFFNYRLDDLLTAKSEKSPVVAGYKDAWNLFDNSADDRLMVVFKAADVGRLVATNKPVPRTYVHIITKDISFYVTTFAGLYTELYGQPYIEESIA